MWWIGMGLGSVAGVVVLRVLLRQVRGLLLDIGDLVCAWTEVFVEYRQQGGPRGWMLRGPLSVFRRRRGSEALA